MTVHRALRAAVVVHVAVAAAFLVAIAAGADGRTLVALGGGVLVTVAWIGWARAVVVDTQFRQPVPTRPVMNGPTVALSAVRPDSTVLGGHVPTAS